MYFREMRFFFQRFIITSTFIYTSSLTFIFRLCCESTMREWKFELKTHKAFDFYKNDKHSKCYRNNCSYRLSQSSFQWIHNPGKVWNEFISLSLWFVGRPIDTSIYSMPTKIPRRMTNATENFHRVIHECDQRLISLAITIEFISYLINNQVRLKVRLNPWDCDLFSCLYVTNTLRGF